MPRSSPSSLPIHALLPDIVRTVKQHPITLLQADPGAGKTTGVPRALVEAGFAHTLVLEPRRLAARLSAQRVADEWGDPLGGIVGYQVRFEYFSSARTKLWYLTEGVLTRKLLAQPKLDGVQLVILDEFHERHLETDLALALLRRLQASIRPDLRLLLMSATLPAANLAAELSNCPVIQSPGRVHPVSLRYTPASADPLELQVLSALSGALKQTAGHLLVFLPGAAEIRKAVAACEPLAQQAGARLLALHGDLPSDEQDLAVQPSSVRKIICSTNVAESSLTIDGVEAVIDSGLARVLTHSPWSGLSRLRVEKISQSSAIQRAGRAGRTGPGIAIRLFPESDFVRRPAHLPPEILRADLAQLLLDLAAAGLAPADLPWLDAPPVETLAAARTLLERLSALDSAGLITEAGRLMARLPLHPRLACFVLVATRFGARRDACGLAAQLAESRLRFDEGSHPTKSSDLDPLLSADLSYAARRSRGQLLEATRSLPVAKTDPYALEKALLCGYPDRVALRRGEQLLLANGASAKLDRSSAAHGEFLVAIEIDDRSRAAAPLVRIAVSIEPDWLLDFFPQRIETREQLNWNRVEERAEQVNSLRYDALSIDESRSAPTDLSAAADLLTAEALAAGFHRFTDTDEVERFLRRVRFAALHSKGIDLPDDLLPNALRHLATGLTSFASLRDAAKDGGLLATLEAQLPVRLLDEIAPTHITLPSGRRARIEYHEGRPPSVASRLQDFFGMKATPTVARGAVPLVVELLAPNRRPVQVTQDLVSFWKNLYPQVRRELSRRYPRHAWPENPV